MNRYKNAIKSLQLNKLNDIYISDKILKLLPNKINSNIQKYVVEKKKFCKFKQLETNSFISKDIIQDIKISCTKLSIFKYGKNRIIKIFSSNYDVLEEITKIDSILNMFDLILKKENKYKIEIYLSNCKKELQEGNIIKPKSVNTGSTYPGHIITLWRKEEVYKVLIHELVHYLFLDIFDYQDEIKYIYDKINLGNKITNPNEAYTEYVAVILFIYWYYKTHNFDISLKKFMKRRLIIELGWSFYQIAKILKFFKCYKCYQDLFSTKCIFNQTTNVLSYYILKTYFLFYSDKFMDCINFNQDSERFRCINVIDLNDINFSKIINNNLKNYKLFINDKTMRMTCIG